MTWRLNDVGSQKGRTFLITGSNTGLGYACAEQLASKGGHIILACRDLQKGDAANASLRRTVPDAQVTLLPLDLANLSSVRQAAQRLLAEQTRIDVLINNAGVMMPPLGHTADGFELQFGINVLGHFALTGLLLPLLQAAPAARVVWVSSLAHWSARIDFGNLNAERRYNAGLAYGQSKLADLMLSYEMQRRLQRRGASMLALAAHPGVSQSELVRHQALLRRLMSLTQRFLPIQPAAMGALPFVRAAVDPAARGGEYYGPAGLGGMSGPPTLQRSSKRSKDEAVAARLWAECERLTGVQWLS